MIWYLVVIICAIALALIGGMPFYLLLLSFSCGVIGLGYHIAVFTIDKLRLRREVQRHKAKWGGNFLYVEGLNIIPNQRLMMLILRRDELLFLGQPMTSLVPLHDVDGILILKGKEVEEIPDAFIFDFLGGVFPPNALANLRNILRLDRSLLHCDIMLLHIKKTDTNKSELIVLVADGQSRRLKDFVKRPEIRQKSRKLNVKLYSLKVNQSGSSPGTGSLQIMKNPSSEREEL